MNYNSANLYSPVFKANVSVMYLAVSCAELELTFTQDIWKISDFFGQIVRGPF